MGILGKGMQKFKWLLVSQNVYPLISKFKLHFTDIGERGQGDDLPCFSLITCCDTTL